MRHTLLTVAVLAVAAWTLPTPSHAAEDPEKAVKAELDKLKAGDRVRVTPIKDDAVAKALPDHSFVAVLFPQFPVGIAPPEGLGSSNVAAVDKDGKVKMLTKAEDLEKFLKDALKPVTKGDAAKDAARAWVRLAQEMHQDGFYTFELMDDSTKVEPGRDRMSAVAKAVAMKGGNGEVSGKLAFDDKGKLVSVSETTKLTPGPRPRCHATKLLDADPVIRQIVEDDLLIMGRAAKPYLDEQRAKVTPELQRAIDRIWERIVETDR